MFPHQLLSFLNSLIELIDELLAQHGGQRKNARIDIVAHSPHQIVERRAALLGAKDQVLRSNEHLAALPLTDRGVIGDREPLAELRLSETRVLSRGADPRAQRNG